jgi:3-oxoacyl-[acyl-carrier protein] reductase
MILKDKVAIITGASKGLGFEIAKKYIEAGVSGLAICARNKTDLFIATNELEKLVDPLQQKLDSCQVDVSNPDSANRFIKEVVYRFGHIDILVNNAGIYEPIGLTEDVQYDEWVRTIEINLFGSANMCRGVLPYLKSNNTCGKIIQIAGGGATKPMPRFSAYAASKAAVVRFAETIATECKNDGIDVNCISPGALNTDMLDEALVAGKDAVGFDRYKELVNQKENGGDSIENAADLAVFLGSYLSDGISGKLISAVWDSWSSLPEHIDELKSTDIYTLRRIVPADRNKNWQ